MKAIMSGARATMVAALVLINGTSGAWAFGHPGHQLIGSLADEMLAGSNAALQVRSILGIRIRNLKTAATWPDCVRDVSPDAQGNFVYNDHSKFHSPACIPFEGAIERPRMEDYVRRNWTNCPGEHGQPPQGCHKQYHFADVASQHDSYDRHFVGTSERDIVSAINAAIAVLLNGAPAPSPFDIKDKKEALLLIAHFVGDLHQPLHVGAVYLDDNGQILDPDQPGFPLTDREQTRGGNKLEDGSTNLHSEWDAIPSGISLDSLATPAGKKRRQVLGAMMKAVPATPGRFDEWPVAWATDTLKASHAAFNGLSFTRTDAKNADDWVAQFNDRSAYLTAKNDLQQQQVVKSGARLARLLKAIWP